MDRDELQDYLSFYRDALRRDPENVEARLRLAGIFRQLDRPDMAISEYETASKILAKRGLPLEAIAACKAILELDPEHTDTQMFLAQLYARNPDAGGSSMRVATPLERLSSSDSPTQRAGLERLDELRSEQDEAPRPLEQTDVTARPTSNADEETTEVDGEPPPWIDDDAAGGDEEKPSRLQLDSDHLNDVSREEMEHLLSTTDIGPEDIVSVEGGVEGTLPGGDPTFEVDVFDLSSLDVGEELPPKWRDLDLEDLDNRDGGLVEGSTPRPSGSSTPTSSTVAVEPAKLPEIPLFSQVDASIFVDLLSAIEIVEASRNSTLIHYGDQNRRLFVVVEGEVMASRSNGDGETVTLARLAPGEFFGEFGMLTQQRSGATVQATQNTKLLSFPRSVVIRVCLAYPDIWQSLWDFYHVRRLDNLLKLHPVFRRLPSQARSRVREAFDIREFRADDVVLAESETAEEVMAVSVGELSIDGSTEEDVVRRPGDVVGLVSAVRDRPIAHRVEATQKTALLSLPGDVCASAIQAHPEVDRLVGSQPFPDDLTD
jgi:CRP-like cAMP-binding protein